jgi:hypothetical protein
MPSARRDSVTVFSHGLRFRAAVVSLRPARREPWRRMACAARRGHNCSMASCESFNTSASRFVYTPGPLGNMTRHEAFLCQKAMRRRTARGARLLPPIIGLTRLRRLMAQQPSLWDNDNRGRAYAGLSRKPHRDSRCQEDLRENTYFPRGARPPPAFRPSRPIIPPITAMAVSRARVRLMPPRQGWTRRARSNRGG